MRSRQGPDRRNGWEFSKSKASWPNKRRALSQYCGFFFSRWSSAVVIGLLVVIVGIIQLKIGFHLDSNRAYTNIDGPKRYLAQFTNAQVTGKQPEFAYFLPKYNKISIKRSADFGGLEYTSLKNETKFYRKISFDDAWLYEQYRGRVVHSVDGNMKAYEHYDNDPPQDEPRDCRRPNWMDFQFPTCNALHELAFDRPRDDYLQPFKYNLVG